MKSPSATFGTSMRQIHKLDKKFIPGPCDYTIYGSMGTGPKYHIQTKYQLQLKNCPGPADYNLDPSKMLRQNPRATIGNSKKEIEIRFKIPGPCTYQPVQL